jgi:nucleoside-diphosphate kinase
MAGREYTYVMIKPDGVKRRLVGEIISRLERKGYQLGAMSVGVPEKATVEKHYQHLKGKDFFGGMLEYMTSGPVVKLVVFGHGVVRGVRDILGDTDPRKAAVGTIRGDLANCVGRNVCHASDTVESAEKEVGLWMGELPPCQEMFDYTLVYEK